MKRFILHVGFHKTATSSIQQTLANNKKLLKSKGYYYPIFRRDSSEIINHSIPFYSAYCDQPELYHINIRHGGDVRKINMSYIEQFDQVLKYDGNVIISGEDISVLPENTLIKIKDKILKAGFLLEVYCSIRRPYSLLCSELGEMIKNGTQRLDSITFPNRLGMVVKLKKVFQSDIVFFSFEKDCETGSPVRSFLERLGLPCNDIVLSTSNEGFGNLSLRALAHINIKNPIIKNGVKNPNGRSFFSAAIDDNKFLLTDSELSLVKDQLVNANEGYMELLGEDFIDKKIETYNNCPLSIDDAVNIYANYAEPHTSLHLLKFLKEHCKGSILALSDLFCGDVVLLRDLALIFEHSDMNISLQLMEQAHKLRPNGPLINKKIIEYRAKINK